MNQNNSTKKFHIGDLLSVTTGRLLSPDHMSGLYRLIDHVTGQQHMTHQLPRASREVEGYLLEQFPWLRDVSVPEAVKDKHELISWISWVASEHGEYHDVAPMPFGQYVGREPMAEIRELRPDAEIIETRLDEEGM